MTPAPGQKTAIPRGMATNLVLLALGLVLLLLYHAQHRCLAENQALQERLAALDKTTQATARPVPLLDASAGALSAVDNSELLRLRGEVGCLRRNQASPQVLALLEKQQQLRAALEKLQAGEPEPAPTATADYWPQGAWASGDTTTPEATLQSFLSAAMHGDTNQFVSVFEPSLRDRMALGGGANSKFYLAQSMEYIFNLKSISVVDRRYLDANTIAIDLYANNGNEDAPGFFVLKQINNQWLITSPNN